MNWLIWALLSAFYAGLTAVLAKIGVEHVNSNLATAIRTVVILIFAWSVALFTENQSIATIGRRTWIFLILSGVATGLSWLCYVRALQLGEASRVAPVDKLGVVIAIVLRIIFLRERSTWHHAYNATSDRVGSCTLHRIHRSDHQQRSLQLCEWAPQLDEGPHIKIKGDTALSKCHSSSGMSTVVAGEAAAR